MINIQHSKLETRGVSHSGLAIYIKKYLKAKEKLWKLKYFTMQKYINLQKNKIILKLRDLVYSEVNQNPSRYIINSISNRRFQHEPKYHLSKILMLKKIDLILPRGL